MIRSIVCVLYIFMFLLLPGVRYSTYADIVIYGGGFAGCAAAHNAAMLAPDKSVLLLVPEADSRLGGLGTVGGQNFTDIRYWRGKIVTQGTFGQWFNEAGQFYSTERMAEIIAKDLAQFPNLRIMYTSDISFAETKDDKIDKIHICPVERNKDGSIGWREGLALVRAAVFIDASDDGRLAKMAGAPQTAGRQDWPAQYLTKEEREGGFARQQAATLMFKVSGLQTPPQPGTYGDLTFVRDGFKSWGLSGGAETWANNPIVVAFNEKYGREGLAIKPLNAAQDGAGSAEWWVNTLLVFNVDGRVRDRDRGSPLLPPDTSPGCLSVDEAWSIARRMLENPDFIEALREFKVGGAGPAADGTGADTDSYGFGRARLVLAADGKPVVAGTMYLRETLHGQLRPFAMGEARWDTENTNYAVTAREARQAGDRPGAGEDGGNYDDRIGLGYYLMDINAYRPEDLKRDGGYRWPVTGTLRPDWQEARGEPLHPVYLPYRMLLAENIKNLLVPGYGAGCSSFAWAELRVLPNLAVLGDAAGAAAARAVGYQENPAEFSEVSVKWVQEKLRSFGSRLDK